MTTQIVDDFINQIRCHAADPVQVQRVDDLEAVLRALFVSDDDWAIDLSDQVRDVIGRKVTLAKRLRMLEQILREGSNEWTTKWSPTGAHE